MAMDAHHVNLSGGKDFVNQTVSISYPAAPISFELVFQSFGFAKPFEWKTVFFILFLPGV